MIMFILLLPLILLCLAWLGPLIIPGALVVAIVALVANIGWKHHLRRT
jgi:hypothetical protein